MKQKSILLIILGSIFMLACGFFWPVGMSSRGMGPVTYSDYESNGERIYFTATNDQGKYFSYSDGPPFGRMMGGRLACVSCHGEDGRGGLRWMHMQQIDAPDIRYSVLASEADEHGNGDEHSEEYDLEIFRQAIVLGKHPDGDSLSSDMPRWEISEDDLADLFEYLKTLP